MRPRVPPLSPVIVFIYAAIVPFGLLFGPIYLVRYLNTSLPIGELLLLLVWALVLLAGSIVLSAHVSTDFTRLLPAMVGGVVVAFGGVQLFVWGTQSVIAMLFGLIALALVIVGSWLGTQIAGHNAHDDRTHREIIHTAGVVVAMAFVTAMVNGTVYWLQDTPSAYSVASSLLLVVSPIVGFVAVWRGKLRLWVFLPLLVALPFVVMIADMVTDPIALLFDLPTGGLLSFNAATIDLSAWVTGLIGAGAIVASGVCYLNLKGRIVAAISTE